MSRSKRAPPDIDAELAALDSLPTERAPRVERLADVLRAAHYRVAAKAAHLGEEGLLYELVPTLLEAYRHYLDKPLKRDPSCFAKRAIMRALVALECSDAEFYKRGLTYRQLEPVWGGTRDTAADVRSYCAMGLVASGFSRALVDLTALLHDAEAAARIGAVRAVACGLPREAELLLRAKLLAGDAEPAVLGECFTGLLSVAPEESLPFVAAYLAHADDAVRELAALALGESRLDGALAPLKEAWGAVLVGAEFRRALLRAAAAHRSEAALDWLVFVVAADRDAVVLDLIEALVAYRRQAKLGERLRAALAERADRELCERFAALWDDEPGARTAAARAD